MYSNGKTLSLGWEWFFLFKKENISPLGPWGCVYWNPWGTYEGKIEHHWFSKNSENKTFCLSQQWHFCLFVCLCPSQDWLLRRTIQYCIIFYLLVDLRKRERGKWEREGDINLFSPLFINSLVASYLCPDQRLNPKPWRIRMILLPTDWDTWPGPVAFYFYDPKYFCWW